jgi:cell division protein FtsB
MPKQEKNLNLKRLRWILWGLLTGLVLLLASAFSRAWRMNQTLEAEVATLAPMLTAVLEDQATLQARLEYVQSDAYVEEWSRVHAGMTQPGETLVVPIMPTATPTPNPTPTPVPTPTPTPAPFWQRWWRALQGG